MLPAEWLYLAHGSTLSQGPQSVIAVLGDTVHAHGLLVLLTVQLQRLQVKVADLLIGRVLGRPQVALPEEALGGVVEGSVTDSVALFIPHPADGTRPVEGPAFLLTFPTKAVGTRQQDGVPEDSLTYRTCQVLPERERVIAHFFFHVLSTFRPYQFLGLLSLLFCFKHGRHTRLSLHNVKQPHASA